MTTHDKYNSDLFVDDNSSLSASSDNVEVKSVLSDSEGNAVSSAVKAAQKTANRRHNKSSSAFRTISEVAKYLGVQQHVLRFWETKFSQVKPLKRGGGRRYYRPEDVNLLRAIHHLLYVEGYTIKGVQKLLRDVGKKQIVATFSGDNPKDHKKLLAEIADIAVDKTMDNSVDASKSQTLKNDKREALKNVLAELKDLRGMIKSNK